MREPLRAGATSSDSTAALRAPDPAPRGRLAWFAIALQVLLGVGALGGAALKVVGSLLDGPLLFTPVDVNGARRFEIEAQWRSASFSVLRASPAGFFQYGNSVSPRFSRVAVWKASA